MLTKFTREFIQLMPTKLPVLLQAEGMDSPIKKGDQVFINYHPLEKITIEQALDMFEFDAHLHILYNRKTSDAMHGWQSCCSFSDPCRGQMYKFNVISDDDGFVKCLTVHIYDSIDIMYFTLLKELRRVSGTGILINAISEKNLFIIFACL